MKLESLVIADQHAAVNMYPSLVLTARHTLGMNFARSIKRLLLRENEIGFTRFALVAQFGVLYTTVGGVTGVKS